ncbi:hypothetical protein SQW_01311 [Enterococcus faecium EnGen0185]|nr:hypothetical protein SQW_01311 [Enterococcus faecium EnGen0185]EOH46512.1 hypothetical protein SSG_01313 [Enterococcus faecium EnGen0190]
MGIPITTVIVKTIQKEDFFNLKKFDHPLVLEGILSESNHACEQHQEHEFQSILLTSDQDIGKDFFTPID